MDIMHKLMGDLPEVVKELAMPTLAREFGPFLELYKELRHLAVAVESCRGHKRKKARKSEDAKRAFNFMMDNGELDNAQLMDVARFSPTAQGQGSLLRQVASTDTGVQNNMQGTNGMAAGEAVEGFQATGSTVSGNGSGEQGQAAGNASRHDAPGHGYQSPPDYVKPAGGTDFNVLGRRRQRDRESMNHLDADSSTRISYVLTDLNSDKARGGDYRFLADNEMARIRGHLQETRFKDMDLDAIKIHAGRTPWYLPSDKDAVTLENRIMVKDGYFNPVQNTTDMDILLEEVIHAGQFQSGMTRPGYLLDAAVGGGYEGSTYEKEAWGIRKSPRPVQTPPSPPQQEPDEQTLTN
jgi:hypothetical protein